MMYISFSKFVRLLVSLVDNIAEGFERQGKKSFCNEVRSQISRAFDKIV